MSNLNIPETQISFSFLILQILNLYEIHVSEAGSENAVMFNHPQSVFTASRPSSFTTVRSTSDGRGLRIYHEEARPIPFSRRPGRPLSPPPSLHRNATSPRDRPIGAVASAAPHAAGRPEIRFLCSPTL